MLDLCCGSGCLAIAVLSNVPGRAVMVDVSPEALSVSRENLRRTNLTGHATCIEADALSAPPMLIGSFDMIVCNPPYIPEVDIMGLDISVRDYEPRLALDGGEDGLNFYRSVCSKWKLVLRPGGWLLFEVGIGQSEQVAQLMAENGFEDIEIKRDTADINRVVYGRVGGNENG
jgi:release factor glutamine methyltransferase